MARDGRQIEYNREQVLLLSYHANANANEDENDFDR